MRDDELYHYGILGMKWGVRRYQNEDGTWTNRGKSRRRSEPRAKKKLTDKQKKVIKNLAIGAGITGAAVGGAILAKKLGPKALKKAKLLYNTKIKGPNMPFEDAVRKTKVNNDFIDLASREKLKVQKGSRAWNYWDSGLKAAKKENRKLFETKIRTGFGEATRKASRTPNDWMHYGFTQEGQEIGKKRFKENYEKFTNAGITALGGVAGGAAAYAGAAATDKLFDEQRDKRIARKSGQKYVKRNMNARASDYMFPRNKYL